MGSIIVPFSVCSGFLPVIKGLGKCHPVMRPGGSWIDFFDEKVNKEWVIALS